ncbi:MAG: DUF4350 domain-containing protein [Planctomycetota bacterium]
MALGVAIGSQHAAYLGPETATMLGAGLCGAGLASAVFAERALAVRAAIGIALALVLWRVPGTGDVFVYAVGVLAALGAVVSRPGGARALLVVAPPAAWLIAQQVFPGLWTLSVWASEWISSSLSAGAVTLGPTGLGLVPLLAVAPLALMINGGSRRRGPIQLGALLVFWPAIACFAQAEIVPSLMRTVIHSRWFGGAAPWANMAFFGAAVPAVLAVLVLAMIGATGWLSGSLDRALRAMRGTSGAPPAESTDDAPATAPAWLARLASGRSAVAAITTIALFAFLAVIAPRLAAPAAGPATGTIYVRTGGLLDFQTPGWERFGVANSGMFGLLVERLRRRGAEIVEIESLETLGDAGSADIAIVINPNEMPDLERDAFEAFVRAGGSGLVLGDHTDIAGTKAPTNRLLEPFGVSLNIDSAYPMTGKWEGKFGPPTHDLATQLDRHNIGLQQSTGASIEIRDLGVRPLLVARHAFSDDADHTMARGDLRGNYRYDVGEAFGDRCVAAEIQRGRGRVLVFADTSMFQNVAVAWTWPFVERVFERLRARPVALESIASPVGLASLTIAAGLALALSIGSMAANGWVGLAVATGVGSAGTMVSVGLARGTTPLAEIDAPTAVIDMRHASDVTSMLWTSRSVSGLVITLERCGIEPTMLLAGAGVPEQAGVYVIPHPRRPLGRAKLDALIERAERGTTVLLAVSGESPANDEDFAEALGLRIDPRPLGPVPVREKLAPSEFAAAMLQPQMSEAYALEALRPSWVPRLTDSGNVIIAERSVGEGRVVVVADSMFLSDRSIESEKEAWIGNVQLVRALVTGESSVAVASTSIGEDR